MRYALVPTLGLCALGLAAQDKPVPKPMAPMAMPMQMPKPGPEMAKLKPFLGTWMVDETSEPSPFGAGGKGHGVGHVTLGPGGLSILIDYQSMKGPMKGFHGNGMMGWDGEAKAYKQAWTDNMAPMVMVSMGHWDGDNFVMESEGTMMGKPFKGRDTFSGISGKGFTITSEMSMDGGPMQKMMTLAHHRAAAKAAAPKAEEKK